jgi:outer membrane protein
MKHSILIPAFLLAACTALADPSASTVSADLPSPLDLKSAIGYALDHNFSILQAREIIRQQEGVIVQVKSQSIPNVTAGGEYQRNALEISQSFPQSGSLWDVNLKATQTLYAGGGVRSAIKSAQLTRDAAALDLQTAIDAALLDVRTKFYNVILTRDQIGVQEDNVKLYQHQLDDTNNQFTTGTVSKFEVLRSKVFLANAQPPLITARNSHRVAIEQLRQSLGVTGSTTFPEVTGDLSFTVQTFEPSAAVLSAHEQRPELKKYEKLESASTESVTTARSTAYPNLQAFGGYEWGGFGNISGSSGSISENGWSFGLQSTWYIFDGRATQGKVRQAKSLLEQARLSKATEELEIDVEVRQSLSSLQEAAELVTASSQTIEEAAEDQRLAEAKYHAGSATQLDVLTAQVSLTQAKTDQLTANYNYLVALSNVRKAIGLSDALVIP